MYQPHAVVIYHCDNLYHQRISYTLEPQLLHRNIFFKESFLSYPTIFSDQIQKTQQKKNAYALAHRNGITLYKNIGITFNDSIPIIHGILLSHLETIFRVGSVVGS